MTSAQGIDVSNWQPDETPAKLAGLQFAIAKATESTYFTDGNFAANWAAMTAAGIARGAYHFLHPDTDGAAQARYFWSVVSPHGVKAGDMLWCDSETSSPSADSCTHAFLTELHALAPAGVVIGTYTNEAVGQTLHTTAAAFPVLWFAWPSTNTPATPGPAQYAPWPKWLFWQWGIRGIDQDAFNGTPADLTAYLHPAAPAPPPVPAGDVTVPDVVGKAGSAAVAALAAAGLTGVVHTGSPVVSQTPGPGAVVVKGSTVNLGV